MEIVTICKGKTEHDVYDRTDYSALFTLSDGHKGKKITRRKQVGSNKLSSSFVHARFTAKSKIVHFNKAKEWLLSM